MTVHTLNKNQPINRNPARFFLPCCDHQMPPDAVPGVHICPRCKAPALLSVIEIPGYEARQLTAPQLAVLVDLEESGGLDGLSPGQLANLIKGATGRHARGDSHTHDRSGFAMLCWAVFGLFMCSFFAYLFKGVAL